MICDTYDSPLGQMRLCCDGENLTAVIFVGQKYEDPHIPKAAEYGSHPILEQTKEWLSKYFDGEIPDFLPPIKPMGTPFQKKVWKALMTIPYGEVRSYAQIAAQIGNSKACRAVGMANHRNPIAIITPCHRIVGANGALTGYALGLEMKQVLLRIEGIRL